MWWKIIFVQLLASLSLFSAEPKAQEESHHLPLADTEADSSLLIAGCVNAMTGTYIAPEVDWTIPSSEPLSLVRIYAHRKYFTDGLHSCWKHNYASRAKCEYYSVEAKHGKTKSKIFLWMSSFVSPSGSQTNYSREFTDNNTKKIVIPFSKAKYDLIGLTNIGSGLISGQTNLKNNLCVFTQSENDFLLGTGAGHNYFFKLTEHTKKKKGEVRTPDEEFIFDLEKECKPNGNLISYDYYTKGNLKKVNSRDESGKNEFGSFTFEYTEKDKLKENPTLKIHGSDERSILYEYERKKLKHGPEKTQFCIKSVTRPELPKVDYEYVESSDSKCYLLSGIKYPKGKIIGFEYFTDQEKGADRVQCIKAPVGSGGSEIPIYHFEYGISSTKDSFKTTVEDAYHNRTIFRYDFDQRIKSVEKYDGLHNLYSKELYTWGASETKDEGNLLSHSIEDAAKKVHCSRNYKYDTRGNVEEEKICGNLTGKGTYDQHVTTRKYSVGYNLLEKEIEPSGKCTTYEYEPNSNRLKSKITVGNGHQIREFFFYDPSIRTVIQKIQDDGSGGNNVTNMTGVTQRLITLTTPNMKEGGKGLPEVVEESYYDFTSKTEKTLQKTVFAYDRYGHLILKELFDANGEKQLTTHYKYNAQGKLIEEYNDAGQEVFYGYDENGNRISSKGPNLDVEIKDTFDVTNRHISRTEIHTDGTQLEQTFSYDNLGRKTKSTDIYKNETHFIYDAFGRCTKIIHPEVRIIDEGKIQLQADEEQNQQTTQRVEQFSYNIFGHVTSHIDPKGYQTKTDYTIWGKPEKIEYPDHTIERFEYTLEGHLEKKIEKNGTYTIYKYDAFGRKILAETYTKDLLLKNETWTYNAFHLISSTDAEGCVSRFNYDPAGRLIEMIRADSRITYGYDALGRQCEICEWYSQTAYRRSTKDYDALGRIVEQCIYESSQTQPLTKVQYDYDEVGNVIAEKRYTEADIAVTQTKYNGHNLPILIIDAENNETIIEYDYQAVNSYTQRVLQVTTTDPLGIRHIITYNGLNQVDLIINMDEMGKTLSKQEFFYNVVGEKEYVRDTVFVKNKPQRVVVTKWQRNAMHQLIDLVEAVDTIEQKRTKIRYNEFGQQETIEKQDGTEIEHAYDSIGRLSQFSSEGSFSYRYEYDRNDHVVAVYDQLDDSVTRRSYDSSGNLISEKLATGHLIRYLYDPLGRPTQVTLPDNSFIAYTYDALEMKEITRRDQYGVQKYQHQYLQHDLSGHLLQAKLVEQAGYIKYSYDLKGRTTQISAPTFNEKLTYNAVGDIKCKETDTVQKFEYDPLHQLTAEPGHTYVCDSLYNCIEKDGISRTFNSLHQLLSFGEVTYTYDANGRLTSKNDHGEVTSYSYDALDRLTSVQQGNDKYQYDYDAFNRRLGKKYYKKQAQEWVLASAQTYLYQGQNEVGACDEQGKIVELRILGVGKGAEIGAAVAVELNTQIAIPIHDQQGNVVSLLDTSGVQLEKYTYTAFGEESIFDAQGNSLDESRNPWRFSSKRIDPETQFVYFGRRYYDPQTLRWTTQDPLGYDAGPNLYAYVMNDPLTHIDLYGLLWESNYSLTSNYWSYSSAFSSSLNSFWSSASRVNSLGSCFLKDFPSTRGLHPSSHSSNFSVGTWESRKFSVTINNGVSTSKDEMFERVNSISQKLNGYKVHATYNATHWGGFADCGECFLNKFGVSTNPVKHQIKNWNTRFKNMDDDGWIAHLSSSQGGFITELALNKMSIANRRRIFVYSFGSARIIDPEKFGLKGALNFISKNDIIPMTDPCYWWYRYVKTPDHVVFIESPYYFWGLRDHGMDGPSYSDAHNRVIKKVKSTIDRL